jgi:hypothetical protein
MSLIYAVVELNPPASLYLKPRFLTFLLVSYKWFAFAASGSVLYLHKLVTAISAHVAMSFRSLLKTLFKKCNSWKIKKVPMLQNLTRHVQVWLYRQSETNCSTGMRFNCQSQSLGALVNFSSLIHSPGGITYARTTVKRVEREVDNFIGLAKHPNGIYSLIKTTRDLQVHRCMILHYKVYFCGRHRMTRQK